MTTFQLNMTMNCFSRSKSSASAGNVASSPQPPCHGWPPLQAVCLALSCLPAWVMASVEPLPPRQACSPLLMEAECAQYLARLRQAPGEAQRQEIILEYEMMVGERQRSCPLLLLAPAKPLTLGVARPVP